MKKKHKQNNHHADCGSACVVDYKGKYLLVMATYEIKSRGEALGLAHNYWTHKQQEERVIPYDSWGDAIYFGNRISEFFIKDFSDENPNWKNPIKARKKK